jgi:spermidine synthase
MADLVDERWPAREPIRALHLGGGGFTLPRYVAATRPGSRQEVAEPDGALLELARQELGLRTDRSLRVRVRDGRSLLDARRPGTADLVVLDAFVRMEVPAQLADAGAVAAAARALSPGGAFCANVVDGPGAPAARALGSLVAEAFAHVAVVATRKVVRGRQGGNVVLVGAPSPLPVPRLAARALRGGVPELLLGGEDARAWVEAPTGRG